MEYTIEELIREGARLKQIAGDAAVGLREVNKKLAELVPFKDGAKSATAYGAGYKAKIQLIEKISWNQEKLVQAKKYFPEDEWSILFKTLYEPSSKKTLDSFLSNGNPQLAAGIRWAMIIKPAVPTVTYEPVKEEPDA